MDTTLAQNLMLSYKGDDVYESYLITYDITDQEKEQIALGNHVNLTDKVTITLFKNQDWYQQKTTTCTDEITVTETSCGFVGSKPDSDHPGCFLENGEPATFITVNVTTVCAGGSGSTGGNNNNNTNSSGTSYSGGGGNPNNQNGTPNSANTEPCNNQSIDIGNGDCATGATLPIIIPLDSSTLEQNQLINNINDYLETPLTFEQRDWISDLSSNQINEISDFLIINDFSQEAIRSLQITINIDKSNNLNAPFSQSYIDSVNCCNTPVLIIDPTLGIKYYSYVRNEIALVKDAEYLQDHQFTNWELTKIYFEANLGALQLGLDIIGVIPAFGEVADIVNGVIYTIQGDGVNATFSYAAAVPFIGWFSTGAKWAKLTITLADGSRTTLKWVVKSGDIIEFGSRGQLRKILGITDSAFQAHHIIPWNKRISDVIQKAAKADSPFQYERCIKWFFHSSLEKST